MTTVALGTGIVVERDTFGSADYRSLVPAHDRVAAANDVVAVAS